MIQLGHIPAGSSPNIIIGWGGRAESSSALASRLEALLEAFTLPGLGSVTEWVTYPDRTPLPVRNALGGFLESRVRKDDAGVPAPGWGIGVQIAGRTVDGVWLVIDVVAGNETGAAVAFTNRVQVSFSAMDQSEVDEYFRTSSVAVLRSLVEIWEPDHGMVGTVQQAKSTWIKMSGIPQSGAVTWWSHQFAIPGDVPGAHLEPFADGTLVVIGSDESADLGVDRVHLVHRFLVDGGFIHPPEARQPAHR